MFKRSLILNLCLLFFVSLFFASCDKEELAPDTTVENFEGEIDPDVPHRQRCFKIEFPVTIQFPGGSTATPASAQALKTIMREWRENNPNPNGKPSFVYPFNVELQDGSVITLESREDWKEVLEECDIPGWRKRCFRLVYPTTVEFPDGTTVTAASAAALKAVLKTWRENHPNAENYPKLVFPYEVVLKNGEVYTIENREDQKELRETCGEIWHKRKCFRYIFPLSVQFPDGSTATLARPKALRTLIKEWKENNPDAAEHPEIIFPHDIELPNGKVITVNNAEELKEYMAACGDMFGKKRCYKLAFPVTLAFPNGDSLEVEDRDAMHEALKEWKEDNPDAAERPNLAYPYNVTLRNGEIITINNETELKVLNKACE